MSADQERVVREERAIRLKWARERAGFKGPKSVSAALNMSVDKYKAHEQGRNGFKQVDARLYAKLFKVSLQWLELGIGSPDDEDEDTSAPYIEAPLISWVSAGALLQPDYSPRYEDERLVYAPDLDPNGDWIALRVDGDSMNRISPHDSIIFVDRKDTRLVPNACYIIGDGEGGATYKRYRPPNTWEPVSTNEEHQPFKLPIGVEPDIIGRVRKTILSM